VLPGLPPVSIDVQVKHGASLSRRIRSVLVADEMNGPVAFGVLPAGDLNGDDVVNVLDFSIMRAAFGRSPGTLGYDRRADVDGDSLVGVVDFSLLRRNFGRAGPIDGP
jgi:hypothetical protein